jgi:broad specificity phosphatase PhoE
LSDNYDRLSEHGRSQARALGQAWQARNVRLDRVLSGPRERQRDTAGEVVGVLGTDPSAVESLAAFDEYPAEEVLAGFAQEMQNKGEFSQLFADAQQIADVRARGRAFDKLLQHALRLWAAGRTPSGVDSHVAFEGRVQEAFAELIHGEGSGRSLALFSSAGTIGAIVGHVLGTDVARRLELGWSLNNASVSEIAFSAGRTSLVRFNDVGHLPFATWTRR